MSQKIIINVNEGKVRGFKTKTPFSGVEYYSFLGIPYAQPPTGISRYKDPVKVKPWNNILDATVEKQGCLQYSLIKKHITGTEDCLYNNIYIPKMPSKADPLRAVVVFIHPGGMFHGSPDPSYFGAPDYIMHHDIVYVCIGFRLHVFGLLNLNTPDCSGNQAIKDMILSLRWIKGNISSFGGDPENITLMGSSSGSAYVHLLLLSPLTKGLYHKAILMGMYIFNPLLVHSNDNMSIAYDIARIVGYDGKMGEDKKLRNFYRKLDFIRFITSRPEKYFSNKTLQVFPAAPFIPAADPSENSPLPLSPDKLIPSTNRVPIVIGFCEREAALGISFLQSSNQSLEDIFHKAISQNCWGWGADLSTAELKQIQKEVEDFYLKGKSIETATPTVLCDILSDAGLSDVYDSLINVISEDGFSVYVYNFHYNGNLDWGKAKTAEAMQQLGFDGSFHAADFGYWCHTEELAGKGLNKLNIKDRKIINTLTSLLTTFAKTNDPNYEGIEVNWKPTHLENPSHLIINETLEVRNEVLNGKRLEFWHQLKRKFKKDSNYSQI